MDDPNADETRPYKQVLNALIKTLMEEDTEASHLSKEAPLGLSSLLKGSEKEVEN